MGIFNFLEIYDVKLIRCSIDDFNFVDTDNDGIIKSATTSTQYGIDSMYVTFDNN